MSHDLPNQNQNGNKQFSGRGHTSQNRKHLDTKQATQRSMIILVLTVQLLLLSVLGDTTDDDVIYTNSWAVQIDGDSEMADAIAASHGFINIGQVRERGEKEG